MRPGYIVTREGVHLGMSAERTRGFAFIKLAAKPASGPEYSLDFAEDGLQLIAELNTGHIIQAGSRPIGLPWITVGTGGWSKDGWQPMGATLIDASLGVGDTANAPGFQSQRVDDAADHRQFFVYIVP